MVSKANTTIAIVGGGLGGLSLAIALGQAGYDVHLFEQAAEFSEIGAGVGIGPNALRAFKLLGIGESYERVADMRAAGADFFRYLMWDDNREVAHVTSDLPSSFVHRKRVLEVLLTLIPANVTKHFNSRVTEVQNVEGQDGQRSRARLHVSPSRNSRHEDWPGEQTRFDADAVIGCDGVHSVVRASLGLDSGENGAGGVRYTGTYAYRGLLDMKKAVENEGEEVKEPIMWVAPNKHILTFPIENDTVMNVVAFVSDRSQPSNERIWKGPWVKSVEQKIMLDDFAGWNQKPVNLLKMIDNPQQWALHELVPLERWTVGRVTLLGDSAHASLPHNGAGASQAVEDAYILGELLAFPDCTADNLPMFLQAYEGVRRERASRQQIHSRESGEIYEFAHPKLSNGVDQLSKHLNGRYDWIWAHSLPDDVKVAKERLVAQGVISGAQS